MGNEFLDKIYMNPIIAAVKDIDKIDEAIESQCKIIFLLCGNIFNLKNVVEKVKKKDKLIFIHIDLLEGFSKDIVALDYIHQNIKPDGIITTKSPLIKHAKDIGLLAIQRLFILDSLSLMSGISLIKNTRPDAVEIMPGIIPRVIETIYNKTKIPIITGGLIMNKDDVIQSLKAGAIGVSSTKVDIWSK